LLTNYRCSGPFTIVVVVVLRLIVAAFPLRWLPFIYRYDFFEHSDWLFPLLLITLLILFVWVAIPRD